MADGILGASFRDPSGYVFEQDGTLFRRVNRSYQTDYDQLMSSGLYEELVRDQLLIPHAEVGQDLAEPGEAYLTLRPERIPFVTYPYEWCFSQLKDAARTTLRIQRAALRRGMTLKDASAYNIQFWRGRAVFIDTLSFTRHEEGCPWVAYRQYCQHFLAPLALAARRDVRLLQLLRVHIDGIPLDLARDLLPLRTWLSPNLFLHIRMHARFQERYASDSEAAAKARPVSGKSLRNVIDALDTAVAKLEWKPEGTEWAEYYAGDSYVDAAATHKRELVSAYLDGIAPSCLWDLGANTGAFSRIASDRGVRTVAFDFDSACVERNYRAVRRSKEESILPLLLDLTNPSPALGWAHAERSSLRERAQQSGGPDAVMALALVHHLAISNNVPLGHIAAFLASLAENLVIEFVPKNDAKVETLLATREDVFPDYTREGFEAAFAPFFETHAAKAIRESKRTLYRMRRRASSPNAPSGAISRS